MLGSALLSTLRHSLQSRWLTHFFVAVLLLSPMTLLGQAGTPAFGAMDNHAYDSINLQQLSVLVHAPIYQKAGAFPLNIMWYANSYCTPITNAWQCGAEAPATTNFGVVTANNFLGGSSSGGATAYPLVTTTGGCPDRTSDYIYSQWVIREANGTLHPLPPADSISAGGDSHCIHTSFTATTIDGSGLTLTVSGTSGYGVSPVITAGGATINQAYPSATSITDPNNNVVSITSTEYNDTFGLTAATASPNVNAPTSVSWTDVNNGSQSVNVTTANVKFQTNFGCSGIADVPAGTSSPQISGLSFPDGTSLGITYEATSGKTGYVTGRIGQLTLPTGGTVSYTYTMNCTGLVTKLVRTTSDGTTTYSQPFSGTTSVTDQGGNVTTYVFSSPNSYGQSVLISKTVNLGSSTTLSTTVYCYNNNTTTCGSSSTKVSFPITQMTVMTTVGSQTRQSAYTYDSYGNTLTDAEYAFGASSPTITTTITYGSCSAACNTSTPTISPIGPNIHNKPGEVVTTQNGSTVGQSNYTYDAHGNLLSTSVWNGSAFIGQTTNNSYNSNGTPATSYDMANNETTYSYSAGSYSGCGSCTNYPFPTSITKGGLTTQATYNGTGGVKLTDVDVNNNNNTITYCYNTGTNCSGGTADPYWRVLQIIDPYNSTIVATYPSGSSPETASSSFTFNSGNSINATTITTDGYGRTINSQTAQSTSGSNYDTTTTAYGWSGSYRTIATSQPCSATSGGTCTTVHTADIDPLGRLFTSSTTSNETLTHTYTQNDDLAVLTPAPTGENAKQVQTEYDGLGRVSKVCHIGSTTSTGSGTACGQKTGSSSGATDAYTYTQGTGYTEVQVQRNSQTRTAYYDALGRLYQTITPEGGTRNYFYDSHSSCPTGYKGVTGQVAAMTDPNGDLICYAYDSLNRVTGVNANGTTCRHFYYDNSAGYSGTLPSGVTLANQYGRMVEAATDSCSSGTLITDEWFAYDKDGRITDIWQLTPHSTQYYHSVATFFENGAVKTIQLASPSLYTITYGLDGEGRLNTLTDASTSIVTGPLSGMYDAAGNVLNVQLTGATPDQDLYTYDANTGRMKTFEFEVGNTPANLTGTLSWNPNGTLGELQVADGFNSGGSETCYSNSSSALGYGYDDWSRLAAFDCGSGNWGQEFSYDQYDNLTQTVISGRSGGSWNPSYNSGNNHVVGATYDSNGNMTNDGGSNVYGWNEFSKLKWTASSGTPTCGTTGKCITYDAFGRAVETSSSGTWTERWYTQAPGSTVYMTGTTANYGYWPSPGRGTYLRAGQTMFLHPDWLGNVRVASNFSHSVVSDTAFAAYGEKYNTFGGTNSIYSVFADMTGNFDYGVLFDTPNREFAQYQGRWVSPDPAGSGWNQYAYATNPNSFIDPTGLFLAARGGCNVDTGCTAPGLGDGGGGGGFCDASGDCGAGTGVDGWGNTGLNGVPWNWGPGYIGTVGSGAGGLLAQQNGWYARCVSYNFNCDANGNYVPSDGAYVITVSCGGTFAQIDCAAPPQAVAGNQSISILTSLGMQHGLGLLAQYQADPMSSSGKDILQQLSQMSGAAQQFIVMGYTGSVAGATVSTAAATITLKQALVGGIIGGLLIESGKYALLGEDPPAEHNPNYPAEPGCVSCDEEPAPIIFP